MGLLHLRRRDVAGYVPTKCCPSCGEHPLLHVVVFAGPLLGLIQFAEGLLDVVHGGDPVSAPLSTGVLEFVVSVLQRAPGVLHFGGHVPLCRLRKQGDSG